MLLVAVVGAAMALAPLKPHDLKEGERCAANDVVGHHMDHLASGESQEISLTSVINITVEHIRTPSDKVIVGAG